jgi:ribosomal protein S18 acetylase RimI-like enzyme
MTAGSGHAVPSGWTRAADAGLAFRPVTGGDLPLLRRIYASTRTEELSVVPWSPAEKTAFLESQFDAQHAHYRRHYPAADFLVIGRAGADVGRLYLDRWDRELRLIDIALLPEHRGQGIGTALLRDVQDEAAAAGKGVAIHVEKLNPARRLYDRLGFVPAGDCGPYDLLRWAPS